MLPYQYNPVNWTDGMKINKSHFIDQEKAILSGFLKTSSGLLNDYSYGLLPAMDGHTGAKYFLSIDNQQQVHLRVIRLTAITRSGYHIQIDEDSQNFIDNSGATVKTTGLLSDDLKSKSQIYYIVLTVNPFERIPYGLPDIEETPPRLPWVRPLYQLTLMPVEEINRNLLGYFHLPLGKLITEGQNLVLDDEYIPPCPVIGSYHELMVIHALVEQFYGKMELYAIQIIQKILQKKQVNEMAGIVQKLCETIVMITSSHLSEIRMLSIYQPPVCLISKLSSFARSVKNTLDFYIGSGKEEFVNYCTEWCNISQGELEASVMELANDQYDHLDINKSLNKARNFTRTISHLFGNLSRLEFIGKRKDAGIFVKENVVSAEPVEQTKKRKSFLAD